MSPLHAELNAILDGLVLAEARGFENVLGESNSLIVVTEIRAQNSGCLWYSW